jgi:hypothetical protein
VLLVIVLALRLAFLLLRGWGFRRRPLGLRWRMRRLRLALHRGLRGSRLLLFRGWIALPRLGWRCRIATGIGARPSLGVRARSRLRTGAIGLRLLLRGGRAVGLLSARFGWLIGGRWPRLRPSRGGSAVGSGTAVGGGIAVRGRRRVGRPGIRRRRTSRATRVLR